VQLGPGTLYGALDRLERLRPDCGIASEDRRHPYRATAAVSPRCAHTSMPLERVSMTGRLRLGLGPSSATVPREPNHCCGASLLPHAMALSTRRRSNCARLGSLDDGTPWWSIAGSFLGGVAKERVFRKPSLRIGSTMARSPSASLRSSRTLRVAHYRERLGHQRHHRHLEAQ